MTHISQEALKLILQHLVIIVYRLECVLVSFLSQILLSLLLSEQVIDLSFQIVYLLLQLFTVIIKLINLD